MNRDLLWRWIRVLHMRQHRLGFTLPLRSAERDGTWLLVGVRRLVDIRRELNPTKVLYVNETLLAENRTTVKTDLSDRIAPKAQERRIVLCPDRAIPEQEIGGEFKPIAKYLRTLKGAVCELKGSITYAEDRAAGKIAVLRHESAAVEAVKL